MVHAPEEPAAEAAPAMRKVDNTVKRGVQQRWTTVRASGFMCSAVVQGKGHVGICGIRW